MTAAIAYPDSLFSREGPARQLPVHGHAHTTVAQLLEPLRHGTYHPLRIVSPASDTPLASGYVELTTTGYHLHMIDAQSEQRINATAARLAEVFQALVSLIDDLQQEAS
ncbi:hypothetical protein SAMN05216571_101231 [Onishia taeanensis]|uniref:Uncharacterized protein n=1 Tax=Onishia taeanensis TaxID=284577 RepID=A0A1G7N4W1_9GAMM|nr:hypothetical protein [Halomonas taeanensis]SDF69088.1 hypothetical protein SAMN05216571_101231 [Halomonas taeanensis]